MPPIIDKRLERIQTILFSVVIVAITLAVYYPAWHGGMIWDDDAHLTRPELQTTAGLGRIWFELGATQQYYPLMHSAFWIQHQLWGNNPLGFHLVNIVLHAFCAVFFVLILKRLKIPGAFLAATIFALHPVHVESVAWMTELKNTLSGVFYLGAALVYLRFDEDRRRGMYVLAIGLFVLALLTKTVTATLPAALLVVFWWQRGRLDWRRDIVPLMPFFVLGITCGLFTAWVEQTYVGASGAEFEFSLVERCLIAGHVTWFYLGKLAWPLELIFIYPRWEISQAVWWQYLYPLAALGLIVGLWCLRHRTRAPLAAMLFFCGTLFPVLGFFNVYPFRFSFVADHFQYLASLSIIALFSAAFVLLLQRWRIWSGAAAVGITIVIALGLCARSSQRSQIYADVETLYTVTLSANPDCWLIHNNLGRILADRGDVDEAVTHYRTALRLKDDFADAHVNLGIALKRMNRISEAMEHYERAVHFNPDLAKGHYNLGIALKDSNRPHEAVASYQKCLDLKPRFAACHYNLGIVLQSIGRHQDAVTHYQTTLELNSRYAGAHINLGNALQALGRFEEAVSNYQTALQIRPANTAAHINMSNALLRLRRFDAAIAECQKALRIQPNSAYAHNNWGNALNEMGLYEQAIEHFQQALRFKPDLAKAHHNLGNALKSLARYDEAIASYQQSMRTGPNNPRVINSLGIVYAMQGQFVEAIKHFEEAIRLDPNYRDARGNLRRAQAQLQRAGGTKQPSPAQP